MATDRGHSPTLTNQTRRLTENNVRNSTKYNFRIQSAPPLSIQQFLRSSTAVLVGAKQWQHSGKYRAPTFNAYLSPAVHEKKKTVEPVWHAPGRYREKAPTSLSPEKMIPKRVVEPVWHAPGHYREKPPTSLSPERVIPKRVVEPVWHAPGRYQEKPPTSLSPERIIPKHTPEPVWHPPGKLEHKPVPYFDPPSLRWSLQELLRSMPEMRPKTFHTSRSMSTLRKSEDLQET
jgi:hypothetical protein